MKKKTSAEVFSQIEYRKKKHILVTVFSVVVVVWNGNEVVVVDVVDVLVFDVVLLVVVDVAVVVVVAEVEADDADDRMINEATSLLSTLLPPPADMAFDNWYW